MKIKLNELKKTAKELNEFLGLEPKIDVKQAQGDLEAKVREDIAELEDGEVEELTELAQRVIGQLNDSDTAVIEEKPAKKATSKKLKWEDLTLPEMVEEADDIDQLKQLVKEEDCFKGIRKGIGIQKILINCGFGWSKLWKLRKLVMRILIKNLSKLLSPLTM